MYSVSVSLLGKAAEALVYIQDGKVFSASYTTSAGDTGKTGEQFRGYSSEVYAALYSAFGEADKENTSADTLSYTRLASDERPSIVYTVTVSTTDSMNSIFLSYIDK